MGFWDNKKILVTGGSGFLGAFVVEKLKQRGCKDIFIPSSKDYNLVEMEAVKRVYQDVKPQIVIHLAARVGGIGANLVNPGKFFYDNLMMGTQMVEVGRSFGIEKFVTVGTVCSYPKFTTVPFREDDFWSGYPEETNAPYGLAKKTVLVQLQAYRQQYGFNGIYLIMLNLYGPRDNFDLQTSHVIPAIIRKIHEAKKERKDYIEVWGTGKPTRGFLYVEDAAEGILLAAERYNKPEPVNLGSDLEISIKDLVELISKIMDFKGEIRWDTAKPDGQPRRRLDISKAYKEFGFKASTQFVDGLKRAIKWFEEKII